MRSALICVFLAVVVQQDGSRAENEAEFRPTPIPLNDWPRDKLEAAALQEIIKTEAPPTIAAVPAHYWEDALRHSVYLTLVRDKIDQLIAKGVVISPDSKPDNHQSKEVDDHDLWEKIKTAPFDRLKEEPIPPSDVTILAKGRLLEDREGYRFAEDDASRNNCSNNNCTKGVKAYWSVKRMRQGETSPGKYHYELTFSVTSQTNKKLKKPYENPVRTFTIKENAPTERPQTRSYEQIQYHAERPQRAIWVHKNIGPKRPPYTRGLDRIFSALFSDEDSYEEPSYRYKQKTFLPQVYPQNAKVGYVDDREQYYHKKQMASPITKHQSFRYTHPPLPPPPPAYVQHPYFNVDPIGNIPYEAPYSDNRYVPSNVKTTRPAVLPTPITNYPLLKESTLEVPVKTKFNATEYTTKVPDVGTTYKIYNHPKQSPLKVNYNFPDHIRPPVYNAPPGVFVTMDKKPFKPMPPLKFAHSNKPHKNMPPDFRPSPQVLDTQFSDPDSMIDTVFRPITMKYTEESNEKEANDNDKKVNKNVRKPNTAKKPPKKHENIKSHRPTTLTPEIITAHREPVEEDNSMEWANLLGAFTKTTPMASHRDKIITEISITTTTPLTTTVADSYKDTEDYEEEIKTIITTTTTTMSPKPKKRTRPPPKFPKQEKNNKHKRVTSTTTTTAKPTRKHALKKPLEDLTPQASSAATSGANSLWETKYKAPIITTTTNTTPRPTTTTQLTTTSTTNTAVDTEQPVATTQPKSKNRFRQSTLMQKGTSVNHDKWSSATLDRNRTNSPLTLKYLRRKASKFHGYMPSSTPRTPEIERDREDHKDHAFNSNKENIISTTTEKIEDILVKTKPTQPTLEEQETNDEALWNHDDVTAEDEDETEEKENAGQESKDDNEFIFPTASTTPEVKLDYINLEKQSTTEITIVALPHSAATNKTKCNKKKHNNLTTTEESLKSSSKTETTANPTTSTTTTTAQSVTPDIFDELFEGFTLDDATEKPKPERSTSALDPKESESKKHERYVDIDDDIKDFLHSLDQRSIHQDNDDKIDEEYVDDDDDDDDDEDDEDDEDEDSPFNNGEENLNSRNLNDEHYEVAQENQNRPFSLLELLAME